MESFKKEITYMSILTVFYCLLSGCDGNSRAFSKSEHLSESSEPNVQQFSNLYNMALKQYDSKDYESAISNLNNALDYVGIIFERDMVYSKLAEIYKIQNKPELELKYLN